jgi:hypothetical protein
MLNLILKNALLKLHADVFPIIPIWGVSENIFIDNLREPAVLTIYSLRLFIFTCHYNTLTSLKYYFFFFSDGTTNFSSGTDPAKHQRLWSASKTVAKIATT